MKNKNFAILSKIMFAVLFFFCAAFCLSSDAAAQKKKSPIKKSAEPQIVIDYLKILPKSNSQIIQANDRADRLSLIKYDRRKDNFLRLGATNFMGYAEIAVFKKKSGGHLVAVNEYAQNSTCCDGGLVFYEYNKGKWKEVEAFPRFSYGDLLTAFSGAAKRQPTEEEMEQRIFEIGEPQPGEITLKIAGISVYGFSWNGTGFDGGMLYLLEEN